MSAPFVYEAPAICPSEQDLRQRVAGWLGGATSDVGSSLGGARLHVDAHLEGRVDRAFQGSASLPRSGAVRELHAATCEELVTAFAFVFAVDLDERVLERARPEPPPAATPPPGPASAPSRPSLDPPRYLTVSAALTSGIGAGVLPHATPLEGLELAARVERADEAGLVASPRLRLGFAVDTPASTVTNAERSVLGASFYALRVRLDACPIAFVQKIIDVSVCARAEASLLHASGTDFVGDLSATDVLFGIGGAARVAFHLSPRWSLGVDGGLVPPFGPDRFTVLEGHGSVYATSPLTGSVQALVAFRFR